MKTENKLTRDRFTRIDLDKYHYFYSLKVPGFEICLEPCAAGFDVCIYTDAAEAFLKKLQEGKICTETGDYTTSAEALFGDRKDEDWNKALEIANELLNKYVKPEERVWQECKHGLWLSPCPICAKEKMAQNDEPQREVVCACYTAGKSLCGNKHSMNTIIPANVTCKRCLEILRENELITPEEIVALRNRAKTITMQLALRATMEGTGVVVTPMELGSGYCVSYTIIDNSPNQLELFSVGARDKSADPADAAHLAKAVLGEYLTLGNLRSKGMTHFLKKVKI